MSYFQISQILIGIAFIFDVASFQFKSRKAILFCIATSTFLIALHFLALGNLPAAGLIFVATARAVIAYFSTTAWLGGAFVAVAGAVLFATWQNPVNLLAFAASVFSSVVVFQRKDKILRIGIMAATVTWLLHNIIIDSPAAVLLEAFFLGSNVLGYWRHYIWADRCD